MHGASETNENSKICSLSTAESQKTMLLKVRIGQCACMCAECMQLSAKKPRFSFEIVHFLRLSPLILIKCLQFAEFRALKFAIEIRSYVE